MSGIKEQTVFPMSYLSTFLNTFFTESLNIKSCPVQLDFIKHWKKSSCLLKSALFIEILLRVG